jgi:hypothetical protein
MGASSRTGAAGAAAPGRRPRERPCWAAGSVAAVRPHDLDAWLPDPVVSTRHARRAAAPPERLWRAALDVRLSDTGTLGRLVRWRIPDTPERQTFRRLLAEYPFVVLGEGELWSVSGLAGRIWTLHRDYPRLNGPGDFAAWTRPGTVRVLFAHWVEDDGRGGSVIFSEARVKPTDRAAELRLRSLWIVMGVFERLIGAEPLAVAARRAEAAG